MTQEWSKYDLSQYIACRRVGEYLAHRTSKRHDLEKQIMKDEEVEGWCHIIVIIRRLVDFVKDQPDRAPPGDASQKLCIYTDA